MPALLLFRDRDPWFKPLGKYNKTGYVTGRNTVIYPRFTRIVERPISKIRDNNKKLIDISRHPKAFLIEMFYANNQITPFLFGMALAHLQENNSQFWDSPVKLPKLNPNPPTEFEERWNCFTKILLPADNIATLDTGHFVSRLIALVDQGTWSHVGLYIGEGRIIEATTSGVVERDIGVYHHPRYRLGVYRSALANKKADEVIRNARSKLGTPYSYANVLRKGIRKKILGKHYIESDKDASPNDVIIEANLELIYVC